MLESELVGELLGTVALVDDDSLRLAAAEVHVDEEQGHFVLLLRVDVEVVVGVAQLGLLLCVGENMSVRYQYGNG